MGYLDSGADITLLPLSFTKILGMGIEDEEIKEIKIGDVNINASVGIALIEDVPYLLGRKDVFNKFRIIFEEYNEKIILEKA